MSHRVAVVPDPPRELVNRVAHRLRDWNEARAPALEAERVFAIAAIRGALLGGAVAWVYGGWAELDVLWVEEQARGRGVGSDLMAAIEDEARKRGCVGLHTDTFTFQALPFYLKLGYEIFGRIEDFSDGNTRYYLKKRLDAPDPERDPQASTPAEEPEADG